VKKLSLQLEGTLQKKPRKERGKGEGEYGNAGGIRAENKKRNWRRDIGAGGTFSDSGWGGAWDEISG